MGCLQIKWAGRAAMRTLVSLSYSERDASGRKGTKMGASKARSLRVRSEYSTGGKARVRRERWCFGGRMVLLELPGLAVVLVRTEDGARLEGALLVPVLLELVLALPAALASLAFPASI